MTQTVIQKVFAPVKEYLPGWISKPIRSLATAVLTPLLFSYRSGHFLSSFKISAVSKKGEPIPWYTYPCIDFLTQRSFSNKKILEFGGGQSSLWWAHRAESVLTFEGNQQWYSKINQLMPENVDLRLVSMRDRASCVSDIRAIISENPDIKYDVVVIDGLYREQMIDIAKDVVADQGVIVVDNADGYDIYQGFMDTSLNRVDFFGYAPGVVLPHSTSIYFSAGSDLFSPKIEIPVISKQ